MKLSAQVLFNNLVGSWQFNRTITGHPMPGSAIGTIQFLQQNNNEIIYDEQGIFCYGPKNNQSKIQREYLYTLDENKNTINVYFLHTVEHNKLFHQLIINNSDIDYNYPIIVHSSHLCVQDTYNTIYNFPSINFQQFSITHKVSGPKKAYNSATDIVRSIP